MGGESDLAGGVSFQATGATTIAWQRGGRAGGCAVSAFYRGRAAQDRTDWTAPGTRARTRYQDRSQDHSSSSSASSSSSSEAGVRDLSVYLQAKKIVVCVCV